MYSTNYFDILGYDCDGQEIYEYRILRGIFTNDIPISDLPFTDPRIYCAVVADDGRAYAISVYDWYFKEEIRAFENIGEDEEIPTIIKPISEMEDYEISFHFGWEEWYYDLDKEELKDKLNSLLEQEKTYVKRIDTRRNI